MHKKGLQILKATIGIETNREELLPEMPLKKEVKSLLTDFRDLEEIPFSESLDGYISIQDGEGSPSYERSGERVRFNGPFVRLTHQASDLRYSLWGNQGFLYRFTLYLLEKKHRIFNFHACALYDERKSTLYVIIGEAGSGKTVYLLSGLARGLNLFSTETVHFNLEDDRFTWFMGSLFDNVRWGTLIHDFPQFLPEEQPPKKEEAWQRKIALDLSSYKSHHEELVNPESVVILFPRIEEGRKGFHLTPLEDERKAAKALFDNISTKIHETVILYDEMPFLGLEEAETAKARHDILNQFVKHKSIKRITSVLSNPRECWGDILERA